MNIDELEMWESIAREIEPFCVNIGGFIHDHLSDKQTSGFCLEGDNGYLRIQVYKNNYLDSFTEKIESPLDDLQYKDPPGTFEGMDINALA